VAGPLWIGLLFGLGVGFGIGLVGSLVFVAAVRPAAAVTQSPDT